MSAHELKERVSVHLMAIPEVLGLGTADDHLVVYVDAASATVGDCVRNVMAEHAPAAPYRIETSAPFQRQR